MEWAISVDWASALRRNSSATHVCYSFIQEANELSDMQETGQWYVSYSVLFRDNFITNLGTEISSGTISVTAAFFHRKQKRNRIKVELPRALFSSPATNCLYPAIWNLCESHVVPLHYRQILDHKVFPFPNCSYISFRKITKMSSSEFLKSRALPRHENFIRICLINSW